jgi:tripartite-type tricarboxylate transporter receptor subunit TctC
VIKVLTTPENRERFLNSGAEVVASTPEVLAAEIMSEVTRLEKIFKGTGIREN